MRYLLALVLLVVGCASEGMPEGEDEQPAEQTADTGPHTSLVTWGVACGALSHEICFHVSECRVDAARRDWHGPIIEHDPSFSIEECEADLTEGCCVGKDCPAVSQHTVGETLACILAESAQLCAQTQADSIPSVCSWLQFGLTSSP